MTELECRALMGDQQAQQECTEKGIVLPCPFCGNDKNIISNWGMFRCWCPNCLAKAEDSLTRNNAIKSWNTRPAPPIGRCKDCKSYESEGPGIGACKGLIGQVDDDFCSEFEPKEREENIETEEVIDPKTIPIVQELREQLAKLTAEHDALLKELAGECGVCAHYEKCRNNPCYCINGNMWEWRG